MYRDEYDMPPRYSRDYYERERFDEQRYDERYEERPPVRSGRGGRGGVYPPPPSMMEDPYMRAREELLTKFGTNIEPGSYVQGSIMITPCQPHQTKPPLKERPPRCDTVFVGGLPDNCSEKNLYDLFCDFGTIMDVRISRSRKFGHIEFKHEASVDKAIQLNGCTIRVGPSPLETGLDAGRIHVDFAQSKETSDAKRRVKSGEMLIYNQQNSQTISNDLRSDVSFEFAAKNLISWLEKGSCSPATANTFFGLLSTVNTQSHKLVKEMKAKNEEFIIWKKKRREFMNELLTQCEIVDNIFDASSQQKAWDHFTKAQRKSISQWMDYARDVRLTILQTAEEPVDGEEMPDEPPSKKSKAEEPPQGMVQSTELERALKEIEQLKVDHEVARDKRDKQILQLKTLLARFKQNCPNEWENIVCGRSSGTPNGDIDTKELDKKSEEQKVEDDDSDEWEVIDGVNVDDLNKALDNGPLTESLAAAAAAYAQVKNQLSSGDASANGMGLSESEVALVAVMASFLTVHPLGASITEMELYFQTLNSAYNSYYLESVLRRLPKVFQLSQTTSGEARWWFLGFQTVTLTQYDTNADHTHNAPPTTTMEEPAEVEMGGTDS